MNPLKMKALEAYINNGPITRRRLAQELGFGDKVRKAAYVIDCLRADKDFFVGVDRSKGHGKALYSFAFLGPRTVAGSNKTKVPEPRKTA